MFEFNSRQKLSNDWGGGGGGVEKVDELFFKSWKSTRFTLSSHYCYLFAVVIVFVSIDANKIFFTIIDKQIQPVVRAEHELS